LCAAARLSFSRSLSVVGCLNPLLAAPSCPPPPHREGGSRVTHGQAVPDGQRHVQNHRGGTGPHRIDRPPAANSCPPPRRRRRRRPSSARRGGRGDRFWAAAAPTRLRSLAGRQPRRRRRLLGDDPPALTRRRRRSVAAAAAAGGTAAPALGAGGSRQPPPQRQAIIILITTTAGAAVRGRRGAAAAAGQRVGSISMLRGVQPLRSSAEEPEAHQLRAAAAGAGGGAATGAGGRAVTQKKRAQTRLLGPAPTPAGCAVRVWVTPSAIGGIDLVGPGNPAHLGRVQGNAG
jgi:hypothetical protein